MHLVIKPRGGERICVPLDRARIRIGRSTDNDVPLTHDPALSRFHMELTRQGGMFYVNDVGSRHGTLLNGRRVLGLAFAVLSFHGLGTSGGSGLGG